MEKQSGYTWKLGMFVTIGLLLFIMAVYFIGKQKNLFGSTFDISTSALLSCYDWCMLLVENYYPFPKLEALMILLFVLISSCLVIQLIERQFL